MRDFVVADRFLHSVHREGVGAIRERSYYKLYRTFADIGYCVTADSQGDGTS